MAVSRALVAAYILAILTVSVASRAEESTPQVLPRQKVRIQARRLRTRIVSIIDELGDDSWQVREKASRKLVALGSKAVPLVAEYVNHRDSEVAMRVKAALAKMGGGAGKVLEGLRLSAALIGRKPAPGEAVPLWLTITNVSDKDVHIFQYFWSLVLQPKDQNVSNHARVVGATSPATFEAQDFLRLKPGQSVGCMMDADPLKGAKGAAAVRAYLEISLPAQARTVIKGKFFSGSSELVSGPIEMTYAAAALPGDPKALALIRELAKGKPEAQAKLKTALQNKKTEAPALKALRAGLRLADADERWKVFAFIGKNPHPALEDDVVCFIDRYGPRVKSEDQMLVWLKKLRDKLPPERRLNFMHRVALAMIHDWRCVSQLASEYTNSSDVRERGLAARIYLLLHKRGDRQPDVMNWLALELYSTANLKLRDRKKARELAELAAKASPNNPMCQLTLACITGDRKKAEKLAGAASTPADQNTIAWNMVSCFPASSWQAALALKVGKKALAAAKPSDKVYRYLVETVAVCYAASGDYARALELEEIALKLHRPGDGFRRDYAERIARFAALVPAGADERPHMALGSPKLNSAGARDALIARLKLEKDAMVRDEIIRLLRTCFGKDATVSKVLETPGKGARK
jgi:tetratricopeptide (TPR) repeat protein